MSLLKRDRGKGPWIIGHRGARGHAPENTMASFRKGVELGAELVECDVHLSSDGVPVVIHDERVDRTTDGTGLVRAMTLEELRRLDAGEGERIPTLDELLAWVASQPELGIAVEIKEGSRVYPGIARRVGDAICARGLDQRAVVISFDHPTLAEARGAHRELTTGILYGREQLNPVAAAREVGAELVMPPVARVNRELVEGLHRKGLGVFTWTANTAGDIARALETGVDGVASDYPDRVAAALRGMGRRRDE